MNIGLMIEDKTKAQLVPILKRISTAAHTHVSRYDSEGCDNPMITAYDHEGRLVAALGRGWCELWSF